MPFQINNPLPMSLACKNENKKLHFFLLAYNSNVTSGGNSEGKAECIGYK